MKNADEATMGALPVRVKAGAREAKPIAFWAINAQRHCEERSDEAIQGEAQRPVLWIATPRPFREAKQAGLEMMYSCFVARLTTLDICHFQQGWFISSASSPKCDSLIDRRSVLDSPDRASFQPLCFCVRTGVDAAPPETAKKHYRLIWKTIAYRLDGSPISE